MTSYDCTTKRRQSWQSYLSLWPCDMWVIKQEVVCTKQGAQGCYEGVSRGVGRPDAVICKVGSQGKQGVVPRESRGAYQPGIVTFLASFPLVLIVGSWQGKLQIVTVWWNSWNFWGLFVKYHSLQPQTVAEWVGSKQGLPHNKIGSWNSKVSKVKITNAKSQQNCYDGTCLLFVAWKKQNLVVWSLHPISVTKENVRIIAITIN